ncbi:hypothetical protein DSL72_003303 [Monilinia vaccinii-corymbosi]|uniref:Protein kinase domain-containing protein n=1 Tax=Monilinia vaccinii-corymbosi TaxID=61207 RepID=A0A8A3P5M9_9HELO|nr:hypothetical protein DSL72_003303 [Monilinia vaccinii-corymbosi]
MSYIPASQRYLDASRGWAPIAIGKDWVGTRCLGSGTYGMATLFVYQGDDPDVWPRELVVKQEGGTGHNLKQESRTLQRLMEYESDHIIKIYKAYHRTMGQGTSEYSPEGYDPAIVYYMEWLAGYEKEHYDGIQEQLADRLRHDVARIYLEYASNSDLSYWMTENCDRIWPSEEYLWRLWECLLKGLMVLKHGTEDWRDCLREEGRKDRHVPIAHFDLKGENILIGDNPKPGHDRIPVHKLADFGLALEVPDAQELEKNKGKKRDWIKVTKGRNTYYAPEQLYARHPNRKIGHQTDIWNIAHVIYMCMNNAQPIPPNIFFRTGVDPVPSSTFKTMGARLLDPDREIYSRKLRGAVLRSLAFDPAERWSTEESLEHVQDVLEHWCFGDEDDLFLGDIHGDYKGWSGTYPEFEGGLDMHGGMKVTRREKKRRNPAPAFFNPKGWHSIEEDEDFAGVRLLFPTRRDVAEGYREMPFELGEAEIPHPLFPSWKRVWKDGEPVVILDSSGEKEEDEEEGGAKWKGIKAVIMEGVEDSLDVENKPAAASASKIADPKGRFTPRKSAGVKRMRGADEEGKTGYSKESDDSDRFRASRTPLSQRAAKKRQRGELPKETPIAASMDERVGDGGRVLERFARRMQEEDEDEENPERSAPWVPVQARPGGG